MRLPALQAQPARWHRTTRLGAALRTARDSVWRAKHALAERFPALIRPRPRQLTIAVTAQCNLRCIGCR